MIRDTDFAKLDQILPADEHLATFQWLTQGIDITESNYHDLRSRTTPGSCWRL